MTDQTTKYIYNEKRRIAMKYEKQALISKGIYQKI